MPANNRHTRIVRSSLFTFLIGKEKEPVTIHTALVEAQSKPLYAMMTNGCMKESTTGVAALEDVDMKIFIAFCEFLYADRYSTPTREEFGEDKKPPSPDGSSKAKSTPTNKGYCEENRKLRNIYADSAGKLGHRGKTVDDYLFRKMWEGFERRPVDYSWEFPSGVGLSFHAQLYVFATKYLIEGLSRRCLGCLHEELRCYKLSEENLHVILDLLVYTYANTGRIEPDGKSLLREMVAHYVACKLPVLAQNDDFWEILELDAEIGADLLREILK